MMHSAHALSAEYHDPRQIHDDVKKYLTDYYEEKSGDTRFNHQRTDISVNRIDPRLKLFQCDNPLTLSMTDNGNIGGNVSVKTQCNGSKPWSIYVSAQIAVLEDVFVAVSNLPKGTVLDAEHIELATINISDIGSHYATDINQLIGKAISRNVRRGKPIRLGNLRQPTVITRGQEVVIEAKTGAIVVAAYATAMSDGRLGEQIKVKNTQSNQIVSATVLASGRVGIEF